MCSFWPHLCIWIAIWCGGLTADPLSQCGELGFAESNPMSAVVCAEAVPDLAFGFLLGRIWRSSRGVREYGRDGSLCVCVCVEHSLCAVNQGLGGNP